MGAGRGSVPQPVSFRWSDGFIRIFWSDVQLERNWSEVQAKIDAQVGTWLQRRLSLKSRARYALYTSSLWSFPDCLYFACLRTVSRSWNNPSSHNCGRRESPWFVDRSDVSVFAMESWGCPTRRLSFLGRSLMEHTVWGGGYNVGSPFPTWNLTSELRVVVDHWVNHCTN